jgi:hypothetical protein
MIDLLRHENPQFRIASIATLDADRGYGARHKASMA